MVDNPSISNLAVEEAIRWVSPVKHFMRYATENYSLRGKEIKTGDALMMLYPLATEMRRFSKSLRILLQTGSQTGTLLLVLVRITVSVIF